MFRHLTKQLKRHRSGLTQAVALFFAATILIASIGRTKATALRLTPPPTATAGDGGLFSFSGDDWLVNLMLAAVAFAGTTSLLMLKRSKGTTPPPNCKVTVPWNPPYRLPTPETSLFLRLLGGCYPVWTAPVPGRPLRPTEQRFWLGKAVWDPSHPRLSPLQLVLSIA